jgi:hypothetical protein
MNTDISRKLETARRAIGWVDARPELATDNPALPKLISALRTATDDLGRAAAEQEFHRVAGLERTIGLSALKVELREMHMKPIVALAQVIAPRAPELAADVRLPHTRASTEFLITSATAMAAAVEPRQALFVEHGLPAGFVEQLRAATAAVKERVDARGATRVSRVGATATATSLVGRMTEAVAVLDAVLKRQLRGTPLLKEWASARRVKQPARPSAEPTVEAGTGAERLAA